MKVFQFGTESIEWVAARDKEAAKAYIECLWGEEVEPEKELTEEDMKKVMLTDLEFIAPEEDPDAEAPTNSIWDILTTMDRENDSAFSIGSTEY